MQRVPLPASIDQLASRRFLQHFTQPLTIPDAILSEYVLRPIVMPDAYTALPPLLQYEGARGYAFSWGHILERRVKHYVVWDFCLSRLLLQYLQAGLCLQDCQTQVFKALEATFNCTSRDLYTLLGLSKDWQLCPNSAVGIFCQIAHFSAEQAAREWIVTELLVVLPQVMSSAQLQVNV